MGEALRPFVPCTLGRPNKKAKTCTFNERRELGRKQTPDLKGVWPQFVLPGGAPLLE